MVSSRFYSISKTLLKSICQKVAQPDKSVIARVIVIEAMPNRQSLTVPGLPPNCDIITAKAIRITTPMLTNTAKGIFRVSRKNIVKLNT